MCLQWIAAYDKTQDQQSDSKPAIMATSDKDSNAASRVQRNVQGSTQGSAQINTQGGTQGGTQNSAQSSAQSSTIATGATSAVPVLLVTIGAESTESGAEQTGLTSALRVAGFSVSSIRIRDDSETSNAVSLLNNKTDENETDGHNDTATDNGPIKLVVLLQTTAAQPHEPPANAYINQLAAASQRDGIPVIAATTAEQTLPEQRPQTAHSADRKAPPYRTLVIRDTYREHDHALLIRQIFSMLNREPAKPFGAYPVPPVTLAGAVALERQQLRQQMNMLIPEWTLSITESPAEQPTTALTRKLTFRSFQAAIQYIHMVAPACDVANHHPRWENNWRTLHIDLTTWDAGQQVSERDTQLARYFDYVYSAFGFGTREIPVR